MYTKKMAADWARENPTKEYKDADQFKDIEHLIHQYQIALDDTKLPPEVKLYIEPIVQDLKVEAQKLVTKMANQCDLIGEKAPPTQDPTTETIKTLLQSLLGGTGQNQANTSADHIFKGTAPTGKDPRDLFSPLFKGADQGAKGQATATPAPTSTIARGLEALLTNLAGSSQGGNKKAYYIKEHIPRTAHELSSPIKTVNHFEDGQWITTQAESKNRLTAATYYAAAKSIETKTLADMVEKGMRITDIQQFKEHHDQYISRIMALFDDYERDAILQLDNVLRSEVHEQKRTFKDDFSEKFVVYMTGKRLTPFNTQKSMSGAKRQYEHQGSQQYKRPDTKSPKACDFFQRAIGCTKGNNCNFEHKCSRCHSKDHGMHKCPLNKK
jgi:hypothetical protein